jgi:pimeloyl-ACP methyl ester carboxylesterase
MTPGQLSASRVTVRTEDDVELAGVLVAPDSATRWGAVFVHGISLNHGVELNLEMCAILAAQGVLSLSVDMRWHDGYDPGVVRDTTFEDTLPDLRASVQLLADRGVERVILLGHSLGAQRIAYYHAATRDPRIAGLVFVEPARVDFDCHRTLKLAWGAKRVLDLLAKAQALCDEGSGETVMSVPCHHGSNLRSTARAFVSYDGLETQASYKHVPEIECPLLILAGAEADKLTAFGFRPDRRALLEAATRSPLKRLVFVDGADHFFSGCMPDVAEVLTAWLDQVRALDDRPKPS